MYSYCMNVQLLYALNLSSQVLTTTNNIFAHAMIIVFHVVALHVQIYNLSSYQGLPLECKFWTNRGPCMAKTHTLMAGLGKISLRLFDTRKP